VPSIRSAGDGAPGERRARGGEVSAAGSVPSAYGPVPRLDVSSELDLQPRPSPVLARIGFQSGSALDSAIYACLLLFCAMLPHSKAVTEIAYTLALVLWLVKLIVKREHPLAQPLVPALMAFLSLSAISTMLGPVPIFNWDRMKSVGLLIISVIFAQNVRTMRRVRALTALLIVSTVASVAYTGFLYAYGIGARIETPAPALTSLGVLPGDVIWSVNRHRVHNPRAFEHEVRRLDPAQPVTLQLARGEWLSKFTVRTDPSSLAKTGLLQPAALRRARPPRAQGSLGYDVTYAEVLVQVALLTWGLLLAATLARRRLKWPLFAAFVLMCAALGATLTRASLVSCFVGAIVVFWLSIPNAKARALSLIVLIVAALGAAAVVQHGRGLSMVARKDAGTEYRVLMWEDGLRLARQHPFFGVGMDTIKADWRELGIRAYARFPIKSHFHSTPIQLAAERGLLTLAAWIWLMVLYIRLLLRLVKRAPDWFSRGLALGLLAATIGFLNSSLVHYNLGDSEVQMLFWFLMGLAIVLDRLTIAPTSSCQPLEAQPVRTA
jgi:hypothetical protein